MLPDPKFFFGFVEDIDDPLKVGRVRVRAVGYHSPNKQSIPTSSLPWAQVGLSSETAVSGLGRSPTGLRVGTMVAGLFIDGADCQKPFVLCSVNGIPSELIEGQELPRYIEESDVNRIARNENVEQTIIQNRIDNVVTVQGINTELKEPETAYNTVYPFSRVYESDSGHVVEVDDSPGSERIHVYHKSGSFVEFYPDGTIVSKTTKDDYRIVQGNGNIYIQGLANIIVDGDAEVKVNSNAFIEVAENVEMVVGGNVDTSIGGNLTADIGGNASITVAGNTELQTTNFTVNADGTISMTASGVMTLKGSMVNIN